jgi:hypothetical protein
VRAGQAFRLHSIPSSRVGCPRRSRSGKPSDRVRRHSEGRQ